MRLVITGASGFLGQALVGVLATQDVETIAVSRQQRAGFYQVETYDSAPGGDVLIHLAETRDRSLAAAAGPAYEDLAASTLASLLDKGYQRVIYASSAVLYGDHTIAPHHHRDPLYINDTYATVKRAGEEAVLAHPGGMVARIANLYGPGMAPNNVVSTILSQIPGNDPLRIFDAQPVRDFLWIEDAALAIVGMALRQPRVTETTVDRIFNIGTGIGTSIQEMGQLALALAGQAERQLIATNPAGRVSAIILDISHTKAIWSWQPTIELRRGLRCLLAGESQTIHG